MSFGMLSLMGAGSLGLGVGFGVVGVGFGVVDVGFCVLGAAVVVVGLFVVVVVVVGLGVVVVVVGLGVVVVGLGVVVVVVEVVLVAFGGAGSYLTFCTLICGFDFKGDFTFAKKRLKGDPKYKCSPISMTWETAPAVLSKP